MKKDEKIKSTPLKELPCIICQGGDVYSDILCSKCEERIDNLDEPSKELKDVR